MKGDFTRDTFDPGNFFSQVFMQQGRVMLDADFNEQGSILLHYLRLLARDLIGPYAAPRDEAGFKLSANATDISIGAGRYYVDGILVENRAPCLYTEQPNYRVPDDDALTKIKDTPDQAFWLYLDVWERHITSLEIDAIREKALGGPDTCSRAQVVWQVKWLKVANAEPGYDYYGYDYAGNYDGYDYGYGPPCDGPLQQLAANPVRLAARLDPGLKIKDACVTAPDSKYRGVENHLYRVEVHRGGKAGDATFKWSRDNASAVTAWIETAGNDLQVANARGFSEGSWVELTDDSAELQGQSGVLVKLTKVGSGVLTLDPSSVPAGGLPVLSELVNPKVRSWDQTQTEDTELVDGAVKIVETPATEDADKATWIDLEDGVQVAFEATANPPGDYRVGDYWLIPARVNTGNIEWPAAEQAGKMSLHKPRGVVHHYAPLGFVHLNGNELEFKSCICEFGPLGDCFASRVRTFGGQLIRDGGQTVVVNPAPATPGKATPADAATDATAPAPPPPAATKRARKRAIKKKAPEA